MSSPQPEPSGPSAPHAVTEASTAEQQAQKLLARVAADEAAAAEARERHRVDPLPVIEADVTIATQLGPSERLHGLRRSAILKSPGGDDALGYGGTLYLTSRRLVHIGQVMVSVQLTDIVESSLAGERLLLALRGGEGLSLDVDQPRLLRAEIAAATQELRR